MQRHGMCSSRGTNEFQKACYLNPMFAVFKILGLEERFIFSFFDTPRPPLSSFSSLILYGVNEKTVVPLLAFLGVD